MRRGPMGARVAASALSLMLAVSPLLGCASNTQSVQDTGKEDMVKDASDEVEESWGKTVPYNKAGEYMVTFAQADFRDLDQAASEALGLAEEDMTREIEPEQADDAVEPGQADDASIELEEADTAAAEPDQADADAIELDESGQAKTDLGFDDISAQDVKVYYQMLTGATEDAAVEQRQAQVSALANNNGALTLTFVDPDAATNATFGYDVVIEAMGLWATVSVDIPMPALSVESGVTSDSESSDVTIQVQDATFSEAITPANITLAGSFANMSVEAVEASNDTLVVHLTGTPTIDYEVASVYEDGQIIIAAEGFDNGVYDAIAYVPVDLPAEAYDAGDDVDVPLAAVDESVDYVDFEGDTGKATINLYAALGSFNDVTKDSISLADDFADGTVESVTKQDDDALQVVVSFPANGQTLDDYEMVGTLVLSAGSMSDVLGETAPEVEAVIFLVAEEEMDRAPDDVEQSLSSGPIEYKAGNLDMVESYAKNVCAVAAKAFGTRVEEFDYRPWDYPVCIDNRLEALGLLQTKDPILAAPRSRDVEVLRNVIRGVASEVTDVPEGSRPSIAAKTYALLDKIVQNCLKADKAMRRGAELLQQQQGAEAPGYYRSESYTAEKYIRQLQDVLKTSKDEGLRDLPQTIASLEKDFNNLIMLLSLDDTTGPVGIFDKLLSDKFNWESQGYYARLAFRANIEYAIRYAWSVTSVWYNATNSAPSNEDIFRRFKSEAEQINELLALLAEKPAGTSPNAIRAANQAGKDVSVYSPTLGVTVRRSRYLDLRTARGWFEIDNMGWISDERIDEYAKHVWGSVWDDLVLAGLEVDDPKQNDLLHGIAFRQRRSGLKYNSFDISHYMIGFDGKVTSKNTGECYASGGAPNMKDTFIWFDLK